MSPAALSPLASLGPAVAAALGRRRRAVLLIVVAALAIPLFAHGCHGDDLDHEPGGLPIGVRSERDGR